MWQACRPAIFLSSTRLKRNRMLSSGSLQKTSSFCWAILESLADVWDAVRVWHACCQCCKWEIWQQQCEHGSEQTLLSELDTVKISGMMFGMIYNTMPSNVRLNVGVVLFVLV